MNMTAAMEARTNKPLTACTDQEIYLALLDIVREQSAARVRPVTGRKLYYISAEFLIGKLLSNNLINLGLYDDTRAALAAAGKNLSDIEEVEPEPSLGNGGLGRLAACFLDSLATLNLPGDGVGLRYHFGLFHQSFKDGVQNELPDPWLTAHSWAEKTDTVYPVEYFKEGNDFANKGFSLKDKAKAIRMAEDMLAERKGYVKDFVGGTISVMCKETKEEVWSKPIGEV